jgi:hypothetical protein
MVSKVSSGKGDIFQKLNVGGIVLKGHQGSISKGYLLKLITIFNIFDTVPEKNLILPSFGSVVLKKHFHDTFHVQSDTLFTLAKCNWQKCQL